MIVFQEHPVYLAEGDTVTIHGVSAPRTFWQWLTRQPRRPRCYRIVVTTASEP